MGSRLWDTTQNAALTFALTNAIPGGHNIGKSRAQLIAEGEALLRQYVMPDEEHLWAMDLSEPHARGKMSLIAMEALDKAEEALHAVGQITIKTRSDIKTRVDAIGLDEDGDVVIYEYKSSLTARLTKNQNQAFTEILEGGGVVVGKGKGIFEGGYQIPPDTTIVIVRRKNGEENICQLWTGIP